MKIQDFCLSEDVQIQPRGATVWSDPITLYAGTFVKMIEKRWVPKHILDEDRHGHFNDENFVFCYCSQGIVMIPRKSIREI